jgi:hypothetical protein
MSYDGGKGGAGVSQWIINQIPPHRVFISAFLGNCAVLRAIRPALITIGIESNPTVISDFWDATRACSVIHGDALEFLRGYKWRGDEFVYLDPPYLLSTRSQQRPLYAHEFSTIEQHRALLTLLRSLPCMIAISGYWSPLYELELAGWSSSTFQTVKRSGETAEEWLWMNYPPPLELHDYRYLGRNFRERERIKRKKQRWTSRLHTMPELERLCLMEAIGELRSSISSEPTMAAGIAGNGDIDEPPGSHARNGDTGLYRQNERGWPPSTDLPMPAGTVESDDTHRHAPPLPTMLEHQR